jgi:hypothetical protein
MRRPNPTPGFDNLGRAKPGKADAHTHPHQDKSFWSVVLTVELIDMAFSLANPMLIRLVEGFANFNAVIDWALVPVIGLIKRPWRLYQRSCREPMPDPVDVLPTETLSFLPHH